MKHAVARRLAAVSVALVGVAVLVVVLSIARRDSSWKTSPQPVPSDNVEVLGSLDGFSEAMAGRITKQITGRPMRDFLVVPVAGGAFPVGTLLRQSPLIPVAAVACQPVAGDPEVMSVRAPWLFPVSYSMSRRVAIDLGLDEGIFKEVAALGLDATQDAGINLAIFDTMVAIWTDNGLNTTLTKPSCRQALKPATAYYLVRGAVTGKRDFSFSLDRTGKANIGSPAVGGFHAEIAGNGSALKLSDQSPSTFAMIMSEVALPQTAAADVRVTAPSTVAASSVVDDTVFVQQDSADTPETGKGIVALLKAQNLKVASLAERIPTSKMPSSPQVRYFRPEDEARAQRVLDVLQKQEGYEKAKLVALRIAAPAGHIEVWLRRAQ